MFLENRWVNQKINIWIGLKKWGMQQHVFLFCRVLLLLSSRVFVFIIRSSPLVVLFSNKIMWTCKTFLLGLIIFKIFASFFYCLQTQIRPQVYKKKKPSLYDTDHVQFLVWFHRFGKNVLLLETLSSLGLAERILCFPSQCIPSSCQLQILQ